jgi:hypothetical protein
VVEATGFGHRVRLMLRRLLQNWIIHDPNEPIALTVG